MIYTHEIDQRKAQEAYLTIIDALREADLTRAEALVGLICALGVQYYGGMIPPERMQLFTKEISDWLNVYFADRDPQQFKPARMHRNSR